MEITKPRTNPKRRIGKAIFALWLACCLAGMLLILPKLSLVSDAASREQVVTQRELTTPLPPGLTNRYAPDEPQAQDQIISAGMAVPTVPTVPTLPTTAVTAIPTGSGTPTPTPTKTPTPTAIKSATPTLADKVGAIHGLVWFDANKDGIHDPSEQLMAGIVVILRDANGTEIARTTTGADGSYTFANLPFGQYTIEFITPSAMQLLHQGVLTVQLNEDGIDGLDAPLILIPTDLGQQPEPSAFPYQMFIPIIIR
jgi:hypothetical protein